MRKTSGIYKITSPSGRVYIGQSTKIEDRWLHYKTLDCADQPKIYNSLVKYGVEKHEFLILEKCEISELNKKERYWQEHYDVILKGLNCKYVTVDGKTCSLSEETRRKISNAHKGKKSNRKGYTHSEETRKKIGEGNKGIPKKGFLGKHSEETKLKMSKSKKGRVTSEETKKKLSLIGLGRPSKLKGKVFTEEERIKAYGSRIGKKHKK